MRGYLRSTQSSTQQHHLRLELGGGLGRRCNQQKTQMISRWIIHNHSRQKSLFLKKIKKNVDSRHPFVACVNCARILKKLRISSGGIYMRVLSCSLAVERRPACSRWWIHSNSTKWEKPSARDIGAFRYCHNQSKQVLKD